MLIARRNAKTRTEAWQQIVDLFLKWANGRKKKMNECAKRQKSYRETTKYTHMKRSHGTAVTTTQNNTKQHTTQHNSKAKNKRKQDSVTIRLYKTSRKNKTIHTAQTATVKDANKTIDVLQ